MPRRRIEERRILGPYDDGNGWRIVVVDPRAEKPRSSFTAPSKKEIDELTDDIKARWSELDDVTVESSLADYKVARMREGTTDASITESIRRIRLMFVDGEKPIAEITEAFCRESYDALTFKVEVATHRNILSQARSWLRWCHKPKGWLRANPLDDVKGIGKPNKGKPQHTGNEARKLHAWLKRKASKLDHAAIGVLMAQTMALRNGDVRNRIVRDVDLDATILHIDRAKSEKSQRPRVIPKFLRPSLLKLIEGRDGDAPLFPAEGGEFHTKSWLRAAMRRFCAAAEVRYIPPHGLKGTAGTVARVVGKTAEDVADFLSHEDVRTQSHYVDDVAVADAQAAKLEDMMTEGEA